MIYASDPTCNVDILKTVNIHCLHVTPSLSQQLENSYE